MPQRLKYPEAQSKRDHYSNLVTTLEANRKIITDNINNARNINAFSLDPQNVDGEYYNRYIAKRDDWITIHSNQIAIFDRFLLDIDTCITKARNIRNMWAGRIGIMEVY